MANSRYIMLNNTKPQAAYRKPFKWLSPNCKTCTNLEDKSITEVVVAVLFCGPPAANKPPLRRTWRDKQNRRVLNIKSANTVLYVQLYWSFDNTDVSVLTVSEPRCSTRKHVRRNILHYEDATKMFKANKSNQGLRYTYKHFLYKVVYYYLNIKINAIVCFWY